MMRRLSTRRRAAAYTTTFSTASTSGIQYGNSQQMLRQRAAGATVARTAHGTRSAHGTRAAHACSSVEAAARTTHATRSAHAICVMVGVHLAASTRPRHAGRRRAGRRRWARHRDCAESMMAFERGFCLLKGIAEGTYNSKHAEAARLYYTTTTTTTTIHIHTHTHLLSFKLEHAHERRCGPNH